MIKSFNELNNAETALKDIESSLNDLKDSIDLDNSKEKLSNALAKQESLKSKAKESGVTLERTKNVFLIIFLNNRIN